MDAKDLIMTILTAGVQLIVLLAFGYLIDYLKNKIGTEQFKKYYDLITKFVYAAEQTLGAGTGAQKKAEVISLIQKQIGNKLSAEEIDKLIEAAVFEMNLVLKQKGVQ